MANNKIEKSALNYPHELPIMAVVKLFRIFALFRTLQIIRYTKRKLLNK